MIESYLIVSLVYQNCLIECKLQMTYSAKGKRERPPHYLNKYGRIQMNSIFGKCSFFYLPLTSRFSHLSAVSRDGAGNSKGCWFIFFP